MISCFPYVLQGDVTLVGCTAAQASIHCSWTKVSSKDQVHVSFLRGAQLSSVASLRLYHSVWSGEGALLGCTWSDDAALIQRYLSLCRGRTQAFSKHAAPIFKMDSLFDADQCVSLASPGFGKLVEHRGGRHVRSFGDQGEDERSEARTHTRVKRGFIVPGTLWCGSGNKAPSYADLGVFSDTDSCCREHDQCKHTILSFQSEFGIFNSNIFTMSHCDCDNKFHSCLMEANDSIADVVGYTFFNLLKMHCFTFSHRLQFLDLCDYWESLEHQTTLTPQQQKTRNDTIRLTAISGSQQRLQTEAFKQKSSSSHGTKEERSCIVYKELDKCKDKILPQQRNYGLHNTEPRTLYHCNCTNVDTDDGPVKHTYKTIFISASVNSCTGVVVKAEVPPLDQRSVAEVEEQRHLQAVTTKVRRPGMKKAKRKDRRVRLYKMCLKMTQSKPVKKANNQVQNAQQPDNTETEVN
uniref:Phospholipase A2 group III n=1 Tax=Fundulus heteroclitus TaxID=8078 RepID=A0A3Q2NQ41_FUNHE